MPNWMPDFWLAEVNKQYEFNKERAVPEDGSPNSSNCSLRHLTRENRNGTISVMGQNKKNKQTAKQKKQTQSQ